MLQNWIFSSVLFCSIGHLDAVYDIRIFIRVREKSNLIFLLLYTPVFICSCLFRVNSMQPFI